MMLRRLTGEDYRSGVGMRKDVVFLNSTKKKIKPSKKVDFPNKKNEERKKQCLQKKVG